MIQLPFAPIGAVRIINIRFCRLFLWNRLSTVKRCSKIEVHRVLELELEQTNNDFRMFYGNNIMKITNKKTTTTVIDLTIVS